MGQILARNDTGDLVYHEHASNSKVVRYKYHRRRYKENQIFDKL